MPQDALESLLGRIHWLGHDSFRIDGPKVIYFDPWKLRPGLPKADVVLVSHEHFDHCSPEDVDLLRGPGTRILAGGEAASKLEGAEKARPGDRFELGGGLVIEAVPAYNLNKFRAPGQVFHPREAGHVGWVLNIDGLRLYFAGDTDFIPEMRDVRCDVALLPVSGTYVMTVDEAVEAAAALVPRVVIPMHYGSGIGTEHDGEDFARKWQGRTVVLRRD